MIVRVAQQLWASAAVDPLLIPELCILTRAPFHALLTSPLWNESDPTQPVSRWLATNGLESIPPTPFAERIAEILRDGIERLPDLDREGVPCIEVIEGTTDWRQGRLSLLDAVALLRRPLDLLVENDHNDGAFVRRLGTPSQRRQLDAALTSRQALFRNAGGIDRIKSDLAACEQPAGAEAWLRRMRLWVLFDRDGHGDDWRQPSDDSVGVSRTLEACRHSPNDGPWPVPGRQLERRAIENYVPTSCLKAWWAKQPSKEPAQALRAERASAFAQLPLELRKVYMMKKPLRARSSPEGTRARFQGIPEDWLAAYEAIDALSAEARRALEGSGFGSVAHAWREPGAISASWPHEPSMDEVEAKELAREGEAIVESILRSM